MSAFSIGRKAASIISLIAGIVLTIVGLGLSIAKTGNVYRGAFFVCGVVLFFAGLYLFPTLKHHRTIVNIIFLFPLLFAFLVTVIIPLILGIGYSFTDWNGIRMKEFVGFANYARMFRQPSFLWSILITFLFVVFNMILVILLLSSSLFFAHQRSRALDSSEQHTSYQTLSVVSYLVISGSSFSQML